MSSPFVIAVAVLALCAISLAASEAQCKCSKTPYTTKYDNINVDLIIRNDRLLKNYVDCLLDKGPCTRECEVLKEILPDALHTDCARCSEKQKYQAGKILDFLMKEKPKYWDALLAKYDPEGCFRKKCEISAEEDESSEESKAS